MIESLRDSLFVIIIIIQRCTCTKVDEEAAMIVSLTERFCIQFPFLILIFFWAFSRKVFALMYKLLLLSLCGSLQSCKDELASCQVLFTNPLICFFF